MRAATAATRPFAIATSRTALMPFFGSIRWPPFSSRSYFCGAGVWRIGAIARHTTTAHVNVSLIALPSSIVVPLCGPLRREVLAHVERPRHLGAGDGAREPEAQRVAVPLRVVAQELHAVA